MPVERRCDLTRLTSPGQKQSVWLTEADIKNTVVLAPSHSDTITKLTSAYSNDALATTRMYIKCQI